jgi:hypothetical protein
MNEIPNWAKNAIKIDRESRWEKIWKKVEYAGIAVGLGLATMGFISLLK